MNVRTPLKPLFVEGSNPPRKGRITVLPNNRWRVAPWLEYPEGTRVGVYGFRADLLVRNPARQPQDLRLELRWHHGGNVIRKYLDYLYQQTGEGTWKLVTGKVRGSSVHFVFRIPTGKCWLSVNPAWHVAHHACWLKLLPRRARVRRIGLTKGGRPIHEVVLGNLRRPTLAVLARCHPYESASSVKAVGIVEWLLGGSAAARQLLRCYCVRVVPMANPDGVALGCARLTRPGGHDLNIDFLPRKDPTAEALKRWIDACQPRLLLNFHNWMSKTHNGLYYRREQERRAFLRAFGHRVWHGRRWLCIRMGADFKPGDPPRQVLDHYASDVFGALAYLIELPWYGWSPWLMRKSGARAFRSAFKALQFLRPRSFCTAGNPLIENRP